MDDNTLDEDFIEDGEKLPATTPKRSRIGLSLYGERFDKFAKISEIRDSIPAFKDFYYDEKRKNPALDHKELIRKYNEDACYPIGVTFYPTHQQYSMWRAKWDFDIRNTVGQVPMETKNIGQLVPSRNHDNQVVLGATDDVSLEAGVRTLAGELLNDAAQMLRDDQNLEEIYDPEVIVKRRKYIVDVFAHTTRMVQGKAALLLKASAEKRENAGFLMTLLAKASSGKLSEEEISALETTYSVPTTANEQQ